jgi:4a-hydroxytetrahydrobiopterin dehydratase
MRPSELLKKKCHECRDPSVDKLSAQTAKVILANLPGWRMSDAGDEISRDFTFPDYHQVMAFVNAVAWISHQEDHHPDLGVHYDHCLVRYSTHSIKGLSENDFICAAKVTRLVEPLED